MQQSAPPLLPIFRSPLQGHLLARLLVEPERRFTIAELARAMTADVSTVSREVTRLVAAGVLRDRRVGRTRIVQANQDSPYYPDLANLVAKAFGPARAAAAAFGAILGVQRVVIFGSWAARAAGEPGPAPGDLDVLLIGRPGSIAAHRTADALTERLSLPVRLTFSSEQEWSEAAGGVVREIKNRPHQEFPTDAQTNTANHSPAEPDEGQE